MDSQVEVRTVENNQSESVVVGMQKDEPKKALVLAGLGNRVVARILDGVVLWIVNIAITRLFLLIPNGTSIWWPLSTILSLLIPVVYETVLVARYGQTLGKMVVKVRVVSDTGDTVNTQRALVRALVAMIPIESITVFFNDKKQAIHDMAAKTVVVEAGKEQYVRFK